MTHDWSDVQWHRALPGKWTNAQIFEHLLLTYTGTTKGLHRAMESGRVTEAKSTLAHRVRKYIVTRLGQMPGRRTAFKQILPQDGIGPESMRRFYDALVAMNSTLNDAERRFGNGTPLLDHPFLGPLNAKEWRRFHRTHTRHHLKQIAETARSTVAVP